MTNLITGFDAAIVKAINEQLPNGWSHAQGVWWPLELSQGVFMVCGDTLMEYSEFSKYAMARI